MKIKYERAGLEGVMMLMAFGAWMNSIRQGRWIDFTLIAFVFFAVRSYRKIVDDGAVEKTL